MKEYVSVLKNSTLFENIDEENIIALMGCLSTTMKKYKKGEYIFCQGEYVSSLCIVADGCVHIQSDDYWGNRTILNEVTVCEMFGESYATSKSRTLNDAVAASDCTVFFFDLNKMMTVCSNMCRFHNQIIKNLLLMLTDKNRSLVQKLTHISKRTTREKLISYLSAQSKLHQSNSFSIPFNRQQLADFLSVDRSAMSNELCKMRDEGLLEFNKSNFTLL